MKPVLSTENAAKSFVAPGKISHTLAHKILRRVTVAPRQVVFENVNFTLNAGESLVILGGNGSGKSTFLRCLAGVMSLSSGKVRRERPVAAVLSHGFGAYEELPVWRNMLLAQLLLGTDMATARRNIPAVAETAGLSDRLLMSTTHCSEGMRAKIALSSLIHTDFQVGLLDETLSHVDADFRSRFQDLTRRWLSQGRSLVFTSHDEQLPAKLATRALVLKEKNLVETSLVSG